MAPFIAPPSVLARQDVLRRGEGQGCWPWALISKADGRGPSLLEPQGRLVQRWVSGLLGGIGSGGGAFHLTSEQQRCLAGPADDAEPSGPGSLGPTGQMPSRHPGMTEASWARSFSSTLG